MSAVERTGLPPQISDEQLVNTVVEAARACGVERYYTIPGRDPFSEIEWEVRDAHIPGKDGPAFEQRSVEFPKFWSQTATNIVAQKYFRGRMDSPERERSVKHMVDRVADTITGWGRQGGYFADETEADTFAAELKAILVNQLASFNSPVWFNVGFEEKPQCSACFILSVEDSMESILDWIRRRKGIIFRGGSGAGVNLARLRSSKEQLSKGGHASGPVSFMRGADASAGTIKSGGKTRRAAKMVVLDVDHPDVEEFIWCKAREEEKARVLSAAGYDMSLDSPHWASIQYQNANNSVRVTDAFMQAVEAEEDWNLTARTDGAVVDTVPARKLLHDMAEAAWQCADPGVQFDTTINSWHTCPNSGPSCVEPMLGVHASRRLGMQPRVAEPHEVPPPDGEFDVEAFQHAVDTVFLAQEIIVGYSSYPTAEIERNAKAYRELGLGYANLGALLMARGLPYDSDEGRAYAAAITALMTGRTYRKSAEIAARMGPFAGYRPNAAAMIGVIAKHRAAVGNIENAHAVPSDLLSAARKAWDDALDLGEIHGFRNSQATVLAPTGTISFMMDCDTTGVEPDFSLVKSKKLVGGGEITIVNRTVPMALEKLGYAPPEVEQIVAYIDERNTVARAPFVKTDHYPVSTARSASAPSTTWVT